MATNAITFEDVGDGFHRIHIDRQHGDDTALIFSEHFTGALLPEAAVAVGIAEKKNGVLVALDCATVCSSRIGNLNEYFYRGRPSGQLHDARRQLNEIAPVDHVPDMAVARADYRLRDRMADDVRGMLDPWGEVLPDDWRHLVRRHRDRIIDELLTAYPVPEESEAVHA